MLKTKHHAQASINVELKVNLQVMAELGSVISDTVINPENNDTNGLWIKGQTERENNKKKPVVCWGPRISRRTQFRAIQIYPSTIPRGRCSTLMSKVRVSVWGLGGKYLEWWTNR